MRLNSIELLHAKIQLIPSWIPSRGFAAATALYSIKHCIRSPCSTPAQVSKHHDTSDKGRRGKCCASSSRLLNLTLLRGLHHCNFHNDATFIPSVLYNYFSGTYLNNKLCVNKILICIFLIKFPKLLWKEKEWYL